MLQGQADLDQSGDAGGRTEVPDVGLHRTDRAEARLGRPGDTECLGQAGHLDRVTHQCPGGMCLDEPDGVRADLRRGQGLDDQLSLPEHPGSGEPGPVPAVVVDRRTPQDGVHVIAVGQGIAQSLECHHPHSAAEDGPGGLRVERADVTGAGVDAAVHPQVPHTIG